MARSTATTPFTTSLVSISLVLFFLGLFATLAISMRSVLGYQKENLELVAVLVPGIAPERIEAVRKEVAQQPFVKSVRYVSAQEAYQTVVKEDPAFAQAMDSLNPFPASLNLHLRAEAITGPGVEAARAYLQQFPEITDINYPIEFIEKVDANSTLITQISLAIGLVLIGIAYLLILNTVRLAIYSRRFVIRTMQLVGATQGYIRRPFVRLGLLQGFIGGLVANVLLVGLVLLFHYVVFPLEPLLQSTALQALYLALILFGTLLGWLSSKRAVNKFLDKTLDQLA